MLACAVRFFAPCRRRARSQLLPPLLLCASRCSTHARALSPTLCRLLAANGLPQCARVRRPPPSVAAGRAAVTIRAPKSMHARPNMHHPYLLPTRPNQTKPNQPPRQTGNHHHVHRHPETEK